MNNGLMPDTLDRIFKSYTVEASAPCRIDMGGTLDISTMFYPLRRFDPCTFNAAINLRTRVRLLPYLSNVVKVSSRGFESAEYPLKKAPFDHPLGLMFAIAAYFGADGIHIDIESSSPPRSALGGSSAAAAALVAAFLTAFDKASGQTSAFRHQTAMLAHSIEASVAGVPCGRQDQLAAVFGGVNAWYWSGETPGNCYRKKTIFPPGEFDYLEQRLLLAYCGIPHESSQINHQWIRQFLSGMTRELWEEIVKCTHLFVESLCRRDIQTACEAMNREMAIRKQMTPDVLDDIGERLVNSAVRLNCGARITGAGGGGCLWALGQPDDISRLRGVWADMLTKRSDARLLDVTLDSDGLTSALLPVKDR